MRTDDDPSPDTAPDDSAVDRARRARLTRRGLLIGGLAVVGLGAGALVYRNVRRSSGPVGTWVSLAPILPASLPSPLPPSPAAQAAGTDTAMAIWAHADDDIIFANPALSEEIASGRTVRAVFVTAGDAGKGLEYAEQREAGIRAAYDEMRGSTAPWQEEKLTLLSGAQVIRFTPSDEPRLSLTMMRLPDGGLDAEGFVATGNVCLTRLINGSAATLTSVDGSTVYDRARLSATIVELLAAAQPTHVTTNIPHESAFARGDHPDHSAVGSLVRALAPQAGIGPEAMSYYIGYPSQDEPANVDGAVLDTKVRIYETYAADDPVVTCADASACLSQPGFGAWLRRSYPKGESELRVS
ncbi:MULTISPECIES: PIG-L family deacetylase [unclassified Microbacterium]|uniref:PIG-L family deacetylase n=1 Tax=unclassified Microbacterium TaxID=2609290 RepID=UPI0023DB0174|nr:MULTISPECIES: PIG-L family deacetylase [unclassified Microbacterium]MDF2044645.1 PIG-L family deacetylase [Microbacterium sp. Kw_RZR3]MDQ1074286.1 LmbE family N-acetylglucosaminyl deacetylase [Microbacterium sp. SORGH_AS_0969]